MPRIVLDEAVNRFREELSKTQQTISAKERLLRIEPSTQSAIDIEGEVLRYKERLEHLILENFSGLLLPYPNISHQALVQRDLSRQKPFSESGRGYRDTLIWMTILSYLESESDEIAFITSNSKDFWSKDSKGLHTHLANELEIKGIINDRFRVYANTQSFNNSVVKSKLLLLSETVAQLQQSTFKDLDLATLLRERQAELQEHLGSSKPRAFIRRHTGMSGYDVEDPQLLEMEGPREIEVQEVLELPAEKLFISFSAAYTFIFQTWVNRESIARWQRSTLLLEVDPQSEDGTYEIVVGFDAKVEFTSVFNRRSKIVENFQVPGA